MVSDNESPSPDAVNLEHLLSIWPIISCLATYTSAGDLISLSRTSSVVRALTHGFPVNNGPTRPEIRQESLGLGRHQTTHWANLKASSRFTCSSRTHPPTKDHPTQPCRFCSQPICRACIVRTFFANPQENTFKHRNRYLCPTCWKTGNLRKDFRYPVDHVSREHIWRGRNYAQRGSFCSCSASLDNWLCIPCKKLQNASGPVNQTLATAPTIDGRKVNPNDDSSAHHMKCYGLDCDNEISEPDRDRRRICLWCSKPLPRQFAGEDRLRWETKQVEIRAAAAASRSADIAEWARNRFRTLTMSRRGMRGQDACLALTNGKDSSEHDRPLFVRHLDAVNYRSCMGEWENPSPESVYQSKYGRWVYSRSFMQMMNVVFKHNRSMTSINGVSTSSLKELTHAGTGLDNARTNLELSRQQRLLPEDCEGVKHLRTNSAIRTFRLLVRYRAVLLDAGLLSPSDDIADVVFELQDDVEDLNHVVDCLFEQIDTWVEMDEEGTKEWMPRDLRTLMSDAGYPKARLKDPGKGESNTREADKVDQPLTDEEVKQLSAGMAGHAPANDGHSSEQRGREQESSGVQEEHLQTDSSSDIFEDAEPGDASEAGDNADSRVGRT